MLLFTGVLEFVNIILQLITRTSSDNWHIHCILGAKILLLIIIILLGTVVVAVVLVIKLLIISLKLLGLSDNWAVVKHPDGGHTPSLRYPFILQVHCLSVLYNYKNYKKG